ncbi:MULTISPECIES: hypothetical protein [Actinomadura]|uniref:Uncharacterized protein n=1 Tax=Actinomadura yumaensis TaxID=111807 RepID=A0ABW2CRZ4_9ACTN|nr:hypothetical protein [Actinomadura sp. J1-007]MWK34145.1 hypothetical protein [Actinomadura sp. J1-007]
MHSERRGYLKDLAVTLARSQALVVILVTEDSWPWLRVQRREHSDRPAHFGVTYAQGAWWFTWSDGALLELAERPNEAADVIRWAMGL